MPMYKIYAGMSGGFGGAHYDDTMEFDNEGEAEQYAYEQARADYESYEGLHGIRGREEIIDEYMAENEIETADEISDDDADELYNNEVESWISYYVEECDNDCENCDVQGDCSIEKEDEESCNDCVHYEEDCGRAHRCIGFKGVD